MIRPDPAKIIVPRKHGQVLIEPPLAEQIHAVEQRPTFNTTFHGTDLRTVRTQARREVAAAAAWWARCIAMDAHWPLLDQDKPWVITGHQVEFYHAGVWAKVLAADAVARKTNAVAIDLLVDHDLVDHLGFELPVETAPGEWTRRPVEYAPASPLPVEHLPAPSIETYKAWREKLREFPAAQIDALTPYLTVPERTGTGDLPTYTQWMSHMRANYEVHSGLTVHHLPTSLLCETDSWHFFVRAWVDNADAWTAAYNAHLAAYRRSHDIKNPQHPMPDLARSTRPDGRTEFELPFWVYRPGAPRERLALRTSSTGPILLAGETALPIQPNGRLLAAPWQLRPRALTLTMFVRLFLADLFIHGIGGALYDQITDALMQQLFGLVPPYACVSAAWLLPIGQAAEIPDISALRWQRHHVKHNPQQRIDAFTAVRTDVAELITARKQLVVQLAAASAEKSQRRTWFDQLHAVNEQLHAKSPRILAQLDEQLATARQTQERNKTLLWREYFFALHRPPSLWKLIAQVRAS